MSKRYENKIWYDGRFSGTFADSQWVNGVFVEGEMHRSLFKKGHFLSGDIVRSGIDNAIIEKCCASKSSFLRSKIIGGSFVECQLDGVKIFQGEFVNCNITKSVWENGIFSGGSFKQSIWKNGYWNYGDWCENSVWHEGLIFDKKIDREFEEENMLIRVGEFVFSTINPQEYFQKKISSSISGSFII